jgi:hypothetical protein
MTIRIMTVVRICTVWSGLLLLCLDTSAVERGFYVGGYYGQTDTDLSKAPFDALAQIVYNGSPFDPIESTSSLDSKDTSYGFYGGYRWFANFAIEGGYMDLGKYVYRIDSAGIDNRPVNGSPNWGQKLSADVAGISVSALGILPLSYRTEVFARGGIIFTSSEITGSITDGVDSAVSGNASKSDTDFLLGVGFGFSMLEIYQLRLEYQRVLAIGDEDLWGEGDLDVISLGVTVTF